MNSKVIYSEEGRDQWVPYVYQLTLSKGEEVYFYIGSRSSKTTNAHPQELLNEDYNSSSEVVHKLLEEGWDCKREILHTFEGTREGAMECCKKEGELLRSVSAQQSDQWLNGSNAGASSYCHSKEFGEKQSEALKGRKNGPPSAETRKRISEATKGRRLSEAHRKKLSEAKKGKKIGPRREETKAKMSEVRKGKPWSPARRAAYEASEVRKGKPWSPARRAAQEARKAQKSSKRC